MSQQLATVAWQGIAVKVPADWSLVGVSGDEKKGYFRVDGPIASALEVRWSPAGGRAPDLMVRGREFLATLEKSCRKNKVKFSSKLKSEKDGAGSVGFTWQSDRLGQGRLIYCAKCDRVVVAQVVSSRDENVAHIAPDVLSSLTDHRDDGWVSWALYGLAFAVPPRYKIDKQKLMSGYLSLSFKSGTRTLVVERWGLVSSLLGGGTLEEWYRKDVQPDIKGYRVGYGKTEVKGHEGLKIEGRRAGVREAAKAAAYAFTLHPHPGVLTGWAWRCEESNRLFSVRATHVAGDDIAESVRDLIRCH